MEFCSVKLHQGSDVTAGVHPSVLLAYLFETEDPELHNALLRENEAEAEALASSRRGSKSSTGMGSRSSSKERRSSSKDRSHSEDLGSTCNAIAEAPKELIGHSIPAGLVLGRIRIVVP